VTERSGPGVTFLQLKPRLANLLIGALQVETDSANIQMLLGKLRKIQYQLLCRLELTDPDLN
jgi:hypothetical protein